MINPTPQIKFGYYSSIFVLVCLVTLYILAYAGIDPFAQNPDYYFIGVLFLFHIIILALSIPIQGTLIFENLLKARIVGAREGKGWKLENCPDDVENLNYSEDQMNLLRQMQLFVKKSVPVWVRYLLIFLVVFAAIHFIHFFFVLHLDPDAPVINSITSRESELTEEESKFLYDYNSRHAIRGIRTFSSMLISAYAFILTEAWKYLCVVRKINPFQDIDIPERNSFLDWVDNTGDK